MQKGKRQQQKSEQTGPFIYFAYMMKGELDVLF